MELELEQVFTMVHKQMKLKSGKASKRALEGLPNYTCHAYVAAVEQLFAGRQNGDVVGWKMQRGIDGTHTNQTTLGRHAGSVTCLLHHQEEHPKLLFSGSSDAGIKVWEIAGGQCIQTVPAHSGTVTGLAGHCDLILSTSSDRTLKTWKASEGRAGLKYPWFVVKQLFVFDHWTTSVFAFPKKMAEDTLGEVFVGDGGGGLTVLKSVSRPQADTDKTVVAELVLVRPHIRWFRSLGISHVLPVPGLNVCLTLSYDDEVLLSDISTLETLQNLKNTENPGARFVFMHWSPSQEELVLADESGRISLWSSRADRFVCWTQGGHKVGAVSFAEIGGRSLVLASCPVGVKVYSVKRSVPFKRHPGHTQRVLGLAVFPSDASPSASHAVAAVPTGEGEPSILISASADNTVRTWSVSPTLQINKTFCEKYSEITAFLCVPEAKVFVTGHENGSVKMWSLAAEKTWRAAGHSNTVSAIAFGARRYNAAGRLENRPHVVTASFDGSLALWDVTLDAAAQPRCEAKFAACRDELLAVVCHPVKHQYITGGNAGVVTMWCLKELQRPRKTASMRCCGEEPVAVTALALDGNILFAGGEDERVRVWDTHTAEPLRVLKGLRGEINALHVDPLSGDVLACTRSGSVRLWAQHSENPVSRFDVPGDEELRAVAYCGATKEVFLGTEEGDLLRVFLTPVPVTAAASSDDGGSPRTQASSIPEDVP